MYKSLFQKTLALLIAIMGFSITATAQANDDGSDGGGKEKIEHKVKRITQELSLNEQQAKDLLKIERDYKEKARAFIQDTDRPNQDRTTADAELKMLKNERSMALGGILTNNQLEKYRKMRAENRPPQHKVRSNQGG